MTISKQQLIFGLGTAWIYVLMTWCHVTMLPAQSLDDQLFEDLAEPKPTQETRAAEEVARDQLQQELQRELGGEDLGQRSEGPLAGMADAMRRVRDRLAAKDTAAETRQMQKSIVNDLYKLIDALKKQQRQQKKASGSQKKQRGEQSRPPQPNPQSKPGAGQANQSNQSMKQSRTQLGQAATVQTAATSHDKMLQESWGNLPANVRQQMQSARPEKFLPKYERLIEQYFQRLAEEER